jgi:hypothetical protein
MNGNVIKLPTIYQLQITIMFTKSKFFGEEILTRWDVMM